jgi:MTH538 TIR-like domain (DUF1863)
MARSTFVSLQRDNWRVRQVLQMGAIEGQEIVSAQTWEYKSAVVVLIGAQTASRPWVTYEITKAWKEERPLVGIRIHGLEDSEGNTDTSGANPFEKVTLGSRGGSVADYVPVYTPSGSDSNQVYASIKNNLESWVAAACTRTSG